MRRLPSFLLPLGLVFVAACGGGGGGSSTPPPAPPAVPTLTSFAPTSAVKGATVTLTGTAFTGATAVSFHGAPATFMVQSGTQIKATVPNAATDGPISVTTPGGSASSAASFSIAPSPVPTLTGLAPASGPIGTPVTLTGTGFTGATSVTFNGVAASFTVQSDTQISATVPAGAATGAVAVTTPGGTSGVQTFTLTASATLDLSVDGFYLTQSTQSYPAAVPLVKDRSAWIRIFVKANEANSARPQVRATFTSGATVNVLTLNAPGLSVPTTLNEGDASKSWNGAVPAAWMQPGVQVALEVDPGGTIPEADKSNNTTAPVALDVRTLPTWKITLLPVTTPNTAGSIPATLTGAVDASNMAAFIDTAKRLWPVPDAVDVAVGAPLTSSLTVPLDSAGNNWTTVLSEVSARRTADGSSRYYYGVVATNYSSGVAGLGYVSGHSAIGWDKSGSRAGVLAHEEGHNFSRPHSPCGGASNPDPNYPTTGNYAGGHIGVTGWDAFASSSNLKAAATYTDVMGYCSTQWVSDYCYKLVLAYRAGNVNNLAPSALPAAESDAEDCLVIWGRIEAGRVILEPAFPARTAPQLPEAGDYRLEALGQGGENLFSLPFAVQDVADLPEGGSATHFAFAVPRRLLGAVQTLRVLDRGVERARQTRLAPGAALPAVAMAREAARHILGWDPDRHPLLVVRDAATGQVRAFLRGGRATLPAGEGLEALACDGVAAEVLPLP